MVARALVLVALWAAVAHAQPDPPSSVLRQGNAAAMAGDWPLVARLVEPLLRTDLASADRGEAHRLAGIAAFFERRGDAERHFVAYLQLDPDGRLDPALYPPDVVAYFNDVASRHSRTIRAWQTSRPAWYLNLVPPLGQWQNGDRTKAYVLGGMLGAALVVNLTTYYYLRAWCNHTDGMNGGALTCFDGKDRTASARRLQPANIASGVAVISIYVFAVTDGLVGYRRRLRELGPQPFMTATPEGFSFGVTGNF